MNCKVLASGSRGNAVLLNDEILIDCGVPFGRLSDYAQGLKLVVLTHIHSDHFKPKTLRALHFQRPALRFLVPAYLTAAMREIGIDRRLVDAARPGEHNLYPGLAGFEMYLTPHDVENCAWTVRFPNGERAFYATDCASLDGVQTKGADLYLLEANYEEQELQERKAQKLSEGRFSYESRAEQTHLSREQALRWLAENATPGKSRVIFLHEHKETKYAEQN